MFRGGCYAERLEAAGGHVVAYVWQRRPHVFCDLAGMLKAASEAIDIAGAFIGQLP
jgi:acetyl esterase/lipase